jgi:hypothetical protein
LGFVDNSGSIISSGDGSFAFGSAKYSSIISSGDGSFAGGSTSSSNEDITSSGIGSFAYGESSGYGSINASGLGSLAFGSGVTSSGDYSFSFGTGFSNSDNESFKIGWDGSMQLLVSNTGGVTIPSLGGSGSQIVVTDNNGLLTTQSIPESLPSQIGNAGKYLTTNGSTMSWNLFNGWSTSGNGGTTAGANFLGTTDSTAFVLKTNNTERMRIATDGVKSYIGVDCNPSLFPGYKKLQTYDQNKKLSFIQSSIEEVKLDQQFDLILTSPPFFKFEEYETISGKQSTVLYPCYKDWLHFMERLLLQLGENLIKDGFLMFHFGDTSAAPTLCQDLQNLFKEVGWHFLQRIDLITENSNNQLKRSVPIWVYRF